MCEFLLQREADNESLDKVRTVVANGHGIIKSPSRQELATPIPRID